MEYQSKSNGEVTQVLCFYKDPVELLTVAHECIHAVVNLLELYNVPISKLSPQGDMRGDETFAYVHTWLFEKVCKKLKIKI